MILSTRLHPPNNIQLWGCGGYFKQGLPLRQQLLTAPDAPVLSAAKLRAPQWRHAAIMGDSARTGHRRRRSYPGKSRPKERFVARGTEMRRRELARQQRLLAVQPPPDSWPCPRIAARQAGRCRRPLHGTMASMPARCCNYDGAWNDNGRIEPPDLQGLG